MNPLFETIPLPRLRKQASDTKLSTSGDRWSQEVMTALQDQHPYLSTYDVLPSMDSIDDEQGYGRGVFVVRNRHALPDVGPASREMMRREGVKFLRIPILISEFKLRPLDVVINDSGEAFPLNERRVRELLYRPELFDTTTKKKDPTPIDRIFLPQLRGAGEYVKTGAEKPRFVLDAIAHTISPSALHSVISDLQNDQTLTKAAANDPIIRPFLEFLDEVEPLDQEKVEKAALALDTPDVIQLVRKEDHYLLKVANTESFAPQAYELDYPTAVELVGREVVNEANESGLATVTTTPTVDKVVEEEHGQPVTEFGEYRVKGEVDRAERVGWVFPEVRSLDGVRMTYKVFNNGDTSCLQDEIVGSRVGVGVNLTRGPIEGYGLFYRITDAGSVVAFEPVEILGKYLQEGKMVFEVTSLSDPVTPVTVKLVDGVQTIMPMGPNAYALPGDIKWMPLGSEVVPLVSNVDSFAKLGAEALHITSSGGIWTFSGPTVDKIAHVLPTTGLQGPDAMFLASCLGLGECSIPYLEKAAARGSVQVYGSRFCTLPEERKRIAEAEILEPMKKIAAVMPDRRVMLREAVHLSKTAVEEGDVDTIDRVLSLSFLNPTNVATFVQYLPEFEVAVKKLANLLIASRLTKLDVEESAVKGAMDSLEKVIDGLRRLTQRNADA